MLSLGKAAAVATAAVGIALCSPLVNALQERGPQVVLGVNITTPTQCGTSIVRWSGDDGPFQLLLTPTTFASQGYNDWIESIPAGTNSYNLTIRQPAGLQFLLTMWGQSGILSAGTTDVMTVGPSALTPEDTSCFLTDQEILDRYAFSFNASSSDPAFPPQCSNITLSWPTSLESNVTTPSGEALDTRQLDDVASAGSIVTQADADKDQYHNLDASSSTKTGNTTDPPTIFGIIPLGNSFSVPVTYSSRSKLAATLPKSSISDNPSTRTRHGVTSLNLTVAMTKGTRFVLVMGIGSQQEWASGGSTSLMTVGQGSFACFFSNSPEGGADTTTIPSITATGTAGPVQTDGEGQQVTHHNATKSVSKVAIVLASIFSVLATLLVMCCCLGVYRLRKRRRSRREALAAGGKVVDQDMVSSDGSRSFLGLGSLGRRLKGKERSRYESSDTPLDILGPLAKTQSRSSSALASPTDRSALDPQGHFGVSSAATSSSPSPITGHGPNPFRDSGDASTVPFARSRPSRETTTSTNDMRSPTSPLVGRPLAPWRADENSPPDFVPPRTLTPLQEYDALGAQALALSPGPRRPLTLHNVEPRVRSPGGEEEEEEAEPELKRDTLAFLGSPTSGTGPSAARPTPHRRRPRRDDAETRYVVHRDAGRIRAAPTEERVLELPPRYEEMNWEQEEQVGEESVSTSPVQDNGRI